MRHDEKLQVFMDVAITIGDLGTCDRKKVGAVIVRNGRCISWGFNGAPPGLDHCDDNGHGWGIRHHDEGLIDMHELSDAAKEVFKSAERPELIPWDYAGGIEWLTSRYGCRNATHAEANALAFAARQGISTDEATLFVGTSPCENCARLIIAAGIVAVYYHEEYRKDDGVRLLTMAGIAGQKI